ncbi:hypothetical protein CFK38_03740 [Brachybacterium vulturis]|uniref:Uncharacterized protein n=1 Tax=Brachybacterium vulturis TaxID=2017484 RepID=A0A291GK60_9MICO|nr:hypothetical protein [Brachybacterium vulturis]ATG50729.1 hypothetical protein CFK38_03740 [Brachybacterium vulturis]
MVQGRGTPSGYDWEVGSVPAEPEPLALPDHQHGPPGGRPGRDGDPAAPDVPAADGGSADESSSPFGAFEGVGPYGAPSFTYDPPAVEGEPRPLRGTLPPWAIVAIVLVQAAALVASVALVLGGIERMTARDPGAPVAEPSSQAPNPTAPPSSVAPERQPGTVTDSAGREVADGTGGYADPATVGEHTVSWTAWTDGTIAVSALEVDLAATVPGAGGQDVVQEGYRLVLVTYEVRYDGPGQLAPAEELWLTGESDLTYFPDVAEGLVTDPMKTIRPLQDGETARFRSAFLVPEAEIDTLRLGVETFSGEILYFATP